MKIPLCRPLLLLATAPFAGAALTNYWPLNETTGTSAPSTVAGGTAATLNPGATWFTDPIRGQVLAFDGVDGYAAAGVLPELGLDTSFTWSFWARSDAAANTPPNNNIILGNRFPNEGWTKFTTNAWEFRDLNANFNESIDYPNFTVETWFHHAVVKKGHLFTYYRNGVAMGNTWDGTGVMPANTPLFFGGDTVNENWAGRLDDVATWTNALSTTAIAGLYGNKYTPATAPLTDTAPQLSPVLSDTFSGDLSNWNVTPRGLEQNADAGYDQPVITGGAVVLGGTTNNQYWYGSSLESVTDFDSRLYTEVSAKRTALTGTGSGYRSSVWIFGDNTHYLHLSQNSETGTGWTFNARDDGGLGTLNPTGGGTNLEGMDTLDTDSGAHQIKFRVLPTGAPGGVNIEMIIDGVSQAVQGFTNFPTTFKVILTGQARAAGDLVSATFDDVLVAQPTVVNQPPVFDKTSYLLPTATIGSAYSQSVADSATDPDNDTITYTKVSGPTWVTVAANGTVSGTPDNSVSTANLLIRASDPKGGEATTTLIFRVNNPAAATPPLFGWWPLNETSGTFGADISGGGNRANITNATTGGLATDGSVWVNDPDFGRVISFNGNDGPTSAAWAVVGSPPASGTLPTMDLTRNFTWSFWAKPTQTANNDIIIGNRYNASGVDYGVPQFTKFTGSQFEWYLNGTNQSIDYPDMEQDVWAHHVLVKDGGNIFYYRDGVLVGGRVITNALTEALPINFGGGANGGEAWSGYLSDVRFFNGALSENAVKTVHDTRGVFAAVSPTFTASLNYLPSVPAGSAFSRSIASLASDPQGDSLTFSKVSGPAWLTVSANGSLGGTPDTSSANATTVIKVQDPSGNSATSTFVFRVEDPALPAPGLFGSWPLSDGSGNTAQDISGNNLPATVFNVDTGGLSDTGSAWLSDPDRGTVLSFEGTDTTADVTGGAHATVGTPPDTGLLPVLDLSTNFTWAFWAKPDQTGNNDIILGNRYNAAGADFSTVQFIKFTSSKFEWHFNGTLQGIDYPDLEPGVWAHHAVVKAGDSLFYYRNGVLAGQSTITLALTEALPVFFGGGANGVENWRGALSDVELFNGAITESAVAALAGPPLISDGSLFFTSITMAPNRAITLNWNGTAGKTYVVYASKTTSGFQSIGESTTSTFTLQPGGTPFNTATETRLFFRVAEKTAP